MTRRAFVARGSILLEVLLSIALFVGAGSFALAATKSVFHALQRAKGQQQAVDLARSKLAELEAGLTSLADLRDEWSGAVGSFEPADPDQVETTWVFDVETSRTEFRGLTLVTLTVSEQSDALDSGADAQPVSVTIRKLMALRAQDPDEYETDELIEGLVEIEP